MSKAVKQSVFILIFLLVSVLAYTLITLVEKQKITDEKNNLDRQLRQVKTEKDTVTLEATQLKTQVDGLNKQVKTLGDEKVELNSSLKVARQQVDDLQKTIDDTEKQRDKYKSRFEDMTKERDDLVVKLQEKSEPQIVYKEKIVYKDKEPGTAPEITPQDVTEPTPGTAPESAPETDEASAEQPFQEEQPRAPLLSSAPTGGTNDEYWASVLREKAALEVELSNLKKELSDTSIEVISLKQDNANLQLEIENQKRAKEDIDREIKNSQDEHASELNKTKEELNRLKASNESLINNLSLELARSQNDKRFATDSADKLAADNKDVREQLKQLVATRGALEKTIIRLKQEKGEIEKKLEERESVIQSKINEIWHIKESLDETFGSTQFIKTNADSSLQEVELPPIRVVSNDEAVSFDTGVMDPGYTGKVISINKENNFIIVDIGEKDGIALGESLSVYRGSDFIASLEVIQVRKDICAADVKEQKGEIRPGDMVR